MKNNIIVFLLSFALFTSLSIAQVKTSNEQINGSKTTMVDKWTPVNYQSEGTTAIFVDDMNGDNTVAGIQARGWYFDDVDGVGLTQTFQGNETVFSAYEGPATGYLGENYNGAAGGGLLIDQWLISPAVNVSAGDSLKFWHRSPDGSTWADHLQVWISSTAGTSHTAFDIQIAAFDASVSGWAQFVGAIPVGGNIRFAVRYYCTNGGPSGTESNYIGLDYFEVVTGGPPCPVQTPANPVPANNAVNVPISGVTLSWSNGGPGTVAPTQVEVFFGPAGNMTSVYSGAPITQWAVPGSLNYFSNYQWKVVNKIDTCDISSSTWAFKTMQDPNLIEYCEPFNDLSNWTPVGPNGLTNWTANPSANAGGTTPELRMGWNPQFQGPSTIRQNTPMSLLNNHTSSFSFKFFLDYFSNPSGTVTVGITYDNGATEEVLYQVVDPTANVGPMQIQGTFTTPATGSDNAKLQITYNGDSYNIDYIYWDDLCIGQVVPVELTSFTAKADNNTVTLNWTTATELNNSGFQIERSNGSEYQTVGFVAGHGTSTNVHNYTFVDQNVEAGSYNYRLKQIDLDGTFEYSNTIEVEVLGLREFALGQNYPNPFNPSTTINFSLAVDSKVSLKVFNVLGQEVASLVNGQMSAGSQKISFDASSLNSGVYFYRLDADGIDGQKFSSTKKMILTK